VTRPGADERKPETTAVEQIVATLGCTVERIIEPGTFDGGDVRKVGDTVYVGLGGRTNAEGIRQFTSILAPLGAKVVPVPITKVLHLKSAVTALPDGTIIGYPPLVDDQEIFERFLAVPEESGSHVVILDDSTLLISTGCPESGAVFESLGYDLVKVDIGEYEKLEGCVTCLSVRVRELSG
jgi:dimethylargininase